MRRLFLFLLCASLLWMVGVVSACGGFFCANIPIDQSAERIIFTINNDDTISAIVGINYTGPAEEFSWIVPVPSVPELDVAETALLDTLERATIPNIVSPNNYCNNLYYREDFGGGGGGGDGVRTGNVGPYDFAILQGVSTQEVVNWLRTNGYLVTDEMIPLIDVYVQEGMYFVALRLSKDSDVGDIQPIVMTYQSDKPMIPIRLTAVAAIEDMPILTWIFADTQYVPENYTHSKVDFGAFRATNRTQRVSQSFFQEATFDTKRGWMSANNFQYFSARDAIQDENNGLAFVTENAMPSQDLLESATSNPELTELLNTYPYVTRLRAQMSPDQMTLDPAFIPAPNEPDLPVTIELNDYVDPLHYYGCSTREALDETTWNNLPTGRTRIDLLNTTIAHPEDWILSEFTFDGKDVLVFAPEPVTTDTIHSSFLPNTNVPPMFVLLNIAQREDHLCMSFASSNHEFLLWDTFSVSYNSALRTSDEMRAKQWQTWVESGGDRSAEFPAILRVEPFSYDCVTHSGYVAYMLANGTQWQAKGDIYRAMLDYAQSAHYLTHPDLQETLMLGTFQPNLDNNSSADWVSPIAIGFPEGMVEQWVGDGSVQISSLDDDLLIELIPLQQFRKSPKDILTRDLVESLMVDYNVDESARQQLLGDIMPYLDLSENPVWNNVQATLGLVVCLPELAPVPFEANATHGYLRFEYDWVVVVRTSIGSAISDDLLDTIAVSMRDPVLSCEEYQRRQDEVNQIVNAGQG